MYTIYTFDQGELDDGDEDDYSSECSEEQEEEERRFFVFGGVTGAGPATNGATTAHPQSTTAGTTGVPKRVKSNRKKRSERSGQQQCSVAQKTSMVPNIYESVESRRARLMHQQQNPGASGPSASAAARNRALELSQSSQASTQGSYGASEFSASSPYYSPLKDDASPAPSQSSTGSAKPASQNSSQPSAQSSSSRPALKAANSGNMRESLSDYGFESQQDFSVFGNLLKKK